MRTIRVTGWARLVGKAALVTVLVGCATSETAESDSGESAPRDLGMGTVDVGLVRPGDAGSAADGSSAREPIVIPTIDPTTTSLPLCEDPATTVNGLPGRPCAGLDSLCSRGVRTASGCCGQAPRWYGTGCGDGMACDTGGNCVPTTEAPWEANSIVGDQTWLDILTDGEKSLITLEPTGFQARFDNASLVDVLPNDGTKIDVGDVHIAHGRAQSLEAVAIAAPDTASRRAVYLLTAPPTADVCVVRGDFDTMGPVSADCDSPGATRVRCPDGDAETHCLVLEGGGVQISGDDLAMVFEMGTFGEQPAGTDVRRALTVDSLDHRWYTGPSGTGSRARPSALTFGPTFGCSPAQCTFGQIRYFAPTCAGGGFSTQTCSLFGCWNSVQAAPEICDGKDNNCNGTIDEGGGATLCNDYIGCTADVCARPYPSAPIQCTNTPLAPLCAVAGTANAQTCMLPRCIVDGVQYGSSLSWPTSGNGTLPVDANQCTFLLRNDWCTNTWDSCDCNARETCSPGWNTMDTSGCRNTPRMTGLPGAGQVKNWPCELDGKYCTFGLCCEPDNICRDFDRLSPTAKTAQVRACDLAQIYNQTNTVVSATGGVVECGDFPEVKPPTLCDDNNPCTFNGCIEPTMPSGAGWTHVCSNPVAGGAHPEGCDAVINSGCAKMTCEGGVCVPRETGTAVTPCSQTNGGPGSSYCGTGACSGTVCVTERTTVNCPVDSLSCTGAPICDSSYTCRQPVTSGCLIGGACVATGTSQPGNPCMRCAGGTSWSPNPGAPCDDGRSCWGNDRCDAAGVCVGTYIPGCIG